MSPTNPSRLIAAALLALSTTLPTFAQHKTPNMQSSLSPKQQSLVAIAAYEAKGDQAALRCALNQALDGALTVNEAKEALSHLYAYTGFPRSLNGLSTLQSVVEERQTNGQTLTTGRDATPAPSSFDALAEGTRVQTQLCGGKPFTYSFAPATDYYLKAHLFGDIFQRDVLSHAEREVVTVAALSALPGAEPQLKAHVAGARNMGVSDAQLHAIPSALSALGLESEAYRASEAVAAVFGETFTEGRPVENMIFPKGEPNTAYAKYFIGNSYLAPLLSEGLPMSNVTFEPRCRNNWHIHHGGGQILICVGGEGWYAEWGKAPRRLRPGDVVNIPAEVKHWHGATASSWFQHIALAVPADSASSEWLEPVEDEEYDKLPR